MDEEKKVEGSIGDVKNCVDCGKPFQLTPGEQQFYLEKMSFDANFQAPKRCKACLQKRRANKSPAARLV